MRTFLSFAFLAVFMLNSALPGTGTLTGNVMNAEGKQLLPMSEVFLYPLGSGEPSKKSLTKSGSFTESKIPPGHYSVAARHEGFGSIIARDLVIRADTVLHLDFLLKSNSARHDSSDYTRHGKRGIDFTIRYSKAAITK